MVIGGMLGALLWRLGQGVLPGLPPEPAPFVIIGMMALFGGIAHAPLAVMLMVAEMTGTLSLLAPAMIAVAVSTAIVGDETIYRAQLRDRRSSPFHRARLSLPELAALRVHDVAEPAAVILAGTTPIEEALERLGAAQGPGNAVMTEDGEVVGSVSRDALLRVPAAQRSAPTSGFAVRATLHPDQPLEEGAHLLAESGIGMVPVVEGGRVVGVVTARGILRAYRAALTSAAAADGAGQPIRSA